MRGSAPLLGSKKKWYDALGARLGDAVAAVEETNRVLGLSRLVDEVRGSGRATLEVMKECMRHAADAEGEACPYLVWGLA